MKKIIKKLMPDFLLNYYHALWPFLGAFIYRYPSRKLKLIGIIGTNGKTTVVHIATHILEKSGFKVASISSLRFKVREHEWVNKLKMTMPGHMKIHKFLRRALRAGCEYAVMEITSEGVKQNRHLFLKFDTTVFTNLTPEHIESHGSFEKYREAKGQFFSRPHKFSIVNMDDENSGYFLDFPAEEKIGYGIKPNTQIKNQVYAENIQKDADGVSFIVENREFKLSMLGEFNVYNTLASISIAKGQGISLKKIQESLRDFKGIPGRMEVVIKKPFKIVVDYAHTPDALEKVYQAIIKNYKLKNKNSKMICVLGAAGGGRDKWKRPEFGKIAAEYCDEIILTDEDPYGENPKAILDEIEKGFIQATSAHKKHLQAIKILDRRHAINTALRTAKENDIVIITGKGAEPLMVTAKGSVEWDDRNIVREEFKKL